jgi:hypothetical protein
MKTALRTDQRGGAVPNLTLDWRNEGKDAKMAPVETGASQSIME